MKLFFIILLFSLKASATNYYVKVGGNDVADGLTDATAWATPSKAMTAISGDSVFFKRGDTWSVTSTLHPASGVYFGAYGTGLKPVISAFQTATGWTNVGNIWSATLTSSAPRLNTVLINGVFASKGRYPNTGYLTFNTVTATKSAITGSLTGTPNYTGGEAVVKCAPWILDVVRILSQSGGTLTFKDSLTYKPYALSNEYFIQNIESVLDVQNEWCYDSASKVIKVFSITEPVVQYSAIDTLLWVNNKSFVSFENISITGANTAAIKIDSSNNISVKYSTVNYSGRDAISATKAYRITIQYDSVSDAHNRAIYLASPTGIQANNCDTAFVDYNYIKRAGIQFGMGASANGMNIGLYVVGRGTTAIGNVIDSIGYNALNFNGNTLIKNNYITNFNLVKDDGGGIYTFLGGGTGLPDNYNIGAIIRGNIVVNSPLAATSAGLYCDVGSSGMTLDSNTVINCHPYSVAFVGPGTITMRNNTVYTTVGGGWYLGPQGGGPFTVKNNIFYVADSTKYTVNSAYAWTGFPIDSNYYLRPIKETNQFTIPATVYSFTAYKSATGYDVHSQLTPTGVTSSAPVIHYNPTAGDSTVVISGRWISARGVTYEDSVIVPAYQSIILFYSVSQPAPRLRNVKILGIN